jgi:uncharacterized protein (DUF2252 family)
MEDQQTEHIAETTYVAALTPAAEQPQTTGDKKGSRATTSLESPVLPPGQGSFVSSPLTVPERQARGRALRDQVPLDIHAAWAPPLDRPNPIALLESQAKTRLRELLPIRYQRMLASPFAFLRGSAIVMAHDLGTTLTTGIGVQLCGDCHLSNFGVYGSPERTLLFDINDFDETLPGPWEWDVKRLATSLVVAGRGNGFSAADCREAALMAAQTYRTQIRTFANMRNLEVWYSHIDAQGILKSFTSDMAFSKKRTKKLVQKARSEDSMKALSKLTEVVNGHRQILNDPPLIVRMTSSALEENAARIIAAYRQTLRDDQSFLLGQYRFVDAARKVVGVGSVGTRCYIALLEGRDEQDPLFIQVKQAEPSVLEAHLPKSAYQNQGQRVVAGQRLMQAESDIFLGWIRWEDGLDYYFRQLKDMKGSVPIEETIPAGLRFYAGVCGQALARAHARSGDRIQIAAYLGKSDVFDQATVQFAEAYANQTERDHKALVEAVKAGKVEATFTD